MLGRLLPPKHKTEKVIQQIRPLTPDWRYESKMLQIHLCLMKKTMQSSKQRFKPDFTINEQ